jgi:hypothetical protein
MYFSIKHPSNIPPLISISINFSKYIAPPFPFVLLQFLKILFIKVNVPFSKKSFK